MAQQDHDFNPVGLLETPPGPRLPATFPRFSELVVELQLQIWDFAAGVTTPAGFQPNCTKSMKLYLGLLSRIARADFYRAFLARWHELPGGGQNTRFRLLSSCRLSRQLYVAAMKRDVEKIQV